MDTHLKGIGLENFRVFKDAQYFNFAPITVLTGTNSSGKSSLINSLKLLENTFSDFNDKKYYNYKAGDLNYLFKKHLSQNYIRKIFSKHEYLFNNKSGKSITSFTHRCFLPVAVEFLQDETDIELEIKYNYQTLSATAFKNSASKLKSIEVSIIGIKDSFYTRSLNENLLKYANVTLADFNNKIIVEIIISKHYDIIGCQIDLHLFYLIYLSNRLYFLDIINKKKEFEEKLNISNNEAIREEIAKFMVARGIKYDIIQPESPDKPTIISALQLKKYEDHELKIFDILNSPEPILYPVKAENEITFLGSWCNNDRSKISESLKIINAYYKKDIQEDNLIFFHVDIFRFLSSIIWRSKIFDFSRGIEADSDIDSSFIYFNEVTSGLSLRELHTQLVDHSKGEFLNKDWWISIIDKLTYKDKKVDLEFLYQLYIPFLNIIFNGSRSAQKINPDSFVSTEPEIAFYEVIHNTFRQLRIPINNFKKIQVVSNNRVNEERFFKINSDREFFIVKNFEHTNSFKSTIKKYLRDFEIADDIFIEVDEDQMTYKVMLSINDKIINLKDLGYGIVKLLPIMLSINPEVDDWTINEMDDGSGRIDYKYLETVVLVEEPESNLHPALQSKLADLFIDLSSGFNIQFIIETHSEYLIRKLQYLTAKKEIKPSDTQIYYFNHPDKVLPEGESHIYPINIREDGSLTKNFGTGFFDEASNIALELFLLKNEQRN